MSTIDILLDRLRAGAGVRELRWLDERLPRAARGSTTDLLSAYTGASRQLGTRPFPRIDAGGIPISHWTCEDAGRLLCLLSRHAAIGDDAFVDDARACFEQGDTREQKSWLRAVALLPGPERFLALAVDACRTNIVPLFEAIACENTYPARFFPERNFNQLVMKAVFNGISLSRIVGLQTHLNTELTRMARDFAEERRAAGRQVPSDLSLAMAAPEPHLSRTAS